MPKATKVGTLGLDGNGSESKGIARRDLLKGLALTIGSSAALACLPAKTLADTGKVNKYPAIASSVGDAVSASDTEPTVEINTGKVRGYLHRGIFAFKGIPYGDTTAGANRFLPPQKAKSWQGIRSSM